MASSLLPFRCLLAMPSVKLISNRLSLQIRAQAFRDEEEGYSGSDANMRILRERIEQVRMKERLERSCRIHENGWNYATGYHYNHKSSKNSCRFFEIFGLVLGTFGFTIVAATLCLCLFSLLLHLLL